ncbi:hypothetical protein JCM8097_000321 [Rhodosporidiobolus ruineniae]
MSASLARTVFRPVPTSSRATTLNSSASACPVSRLVFPSSSSSSSTPVMRPSTSARTANALAHLTVGAAVLASALSLLHRPDSVVFDHPPRSAISWVPSKHLAAREAHAPTSSSSAFPPSSRSAARLTSGQVAFSGPRGCIVERGQPLAHELRMAGVLGRSLGH